VLVESITQASPGKVVEVTLGGNGRQSVTIGGETSLPFLRQDGQMPHRPIVAVDVEDREPVGWSRTLLDAWRDVLKDPARWARAAVAAGADAIALTLTSTRPDRDDAPASAAVESVRRVLDAVDVPLIVLGPGTAAKDNEVLVAVADATAGAGLALGVCEDTNYRTIVAACLAAGHIAIAKSPIDLNLAKQLNILVSEMGLPIERTLMDPTTGALGYGVEYSYSVMERLRLSALQGDKWCSLPMICQVGYEAWRQKEARAPESVPAEWGDFTRRGVLWEAMTANTLLHAGADILVMRHPQAIALVQSTIGRLMG
jgi:acetyl-CoA decarbonylase/synthase, CODH/ACS complex subunit delta